ncbi:MAG: hypothetical protein OK422_06350 [Thaumarchaeota archaeon]|nr:hypothetical protein [Nitrososphaerota archaeon]
MRRRNRVAIAAYIESFTLIALVMAGSAYVYSTATQYGVSAQGPGLTISSSSLRQGLDVAVEKLAILNTGTVPLTSFTLTTQGSPSSGAFYLSLVNPENPSSAPSSTCGMGTNPASVTICSSLLPGQSLLVTLTMTGNIFAVGGMYLISVSATPIAQGLQQVPAVPG